MLKRLLASKLFIIVSFLVATLIFSSAISSLTVVKRMELWSFDTRMAWLRTDAVIDDDVAIILIDEASLKAMDSTYGRFPWPRTAYAEVLDFLSLGNPKAVIFDLLFTQRELNKFKNSYSGPDQDFIDATARYPNVIHAAQMFHDSTIKSVKSEDVLQLPSDLVRKFGTPGDFEDPIQRNNSYVVPMEELWRAASGLGIVTIASDIDGIYRRVPFYHEYDNSYYPSLSISPISHLQTIENSQLRDGFGLENYPPGTEHVINMYGDYKPYSISGIFASWNQIKNGDFENILISPEEFEGKYVFVGASAVGLDDIKATAISNVSPGVTIHAMALSNILSGDSLREISRRYTTFLGLFIAGISLYLILYSKHYLLSYLVPSLLILTFVYMSFVLFSMNYVIEIVNPFLIAIISIFMAASYKAITEGKDRRRVKHMFSQYVSHAVLDKLLDTYEDTIKAGDGTREKITILFSDIRGFTNLSEALTPEQVVELLNIYLSEMSNVIMKYEGTIDKYIGDAIMAFWGAPVLIDDHAHRALVASLDMINGLVNVNEKLALKGYGELKVGIGLHTGSAVLGNIGSENKLDYTVIGDAVNLASRVESLTKQYGCALLVTEDTKNEISEDFHLGVVDAVQVKGKKIPIKLYAPPVDINGRLLTNDAAEHDKIWMDKGFELYVARDWSAAIDAYNKLQNKVLSDTYVKRCEHYIQQAPLDEWDGVFVHTSK